MTIVMEPGTIRTIHYHRPKGEDGRYPVTYWGTVEEQIAEATLANARAVSTTDHTAMPLYTLQEYCPHTNPEDDDKYAGVDDLIDEWMARNCPGLTATVGDGPEVYQLIWANRQRSYAVIPLAAEWRRAQEAFDDGHNGVCLEQYQGTCCAECTEGDEDFGFEPESCRLAERIREEHDDFWWRVSPEGMEDRSRNA